VFLAGGVDRDAVALAQGFEGLGVGGIVADRVVN
jgi:hypothetical protein